ncbi:MAG: DUF935 family protein [Chitinophagaceae bacterium]
MAKAQRKNKDIVQVATPDNNGQIVVNNMQVRLQSVDRTSTDIAKFLTALQSAESIHYPNRGYLYDIYTQMELDAHLAGIIEKRIATVLNKKLCFEQGEKENEEIGNLIKTKAFRDMLRELMLQKFWGLTGLEFIPGETFAFNSIPRKHIKPNLRIIAKDEYGQDGLSYDGVWNLWIIGHWKDLGILLSCCPYSIWKRGGFGDYAQYVEIFGQPMIIVKYSGYDEKTRTALDQTMRDIGSSTRIMIPNEANWDVVDGKNAQGTGDLQSKFIDACNREMTIRILGATETTSSSSSSGYAQSKEHGKQQDETTKIDLAFIENLLNEPHYFRILESYGYAPGTGHFYFKDEVDLTELQSKINIAKTVAQITPVSDDYFYELSGIPKPDNYDELKEQKEAERQAITGAEEQNDDNPDDPIPGKPVKKKKASEKKTEDLKAVLKQMGFWDKLKAVFFKAP